jgi:hypothetical protein
MWWMQQSVREAFDNNLQNQANINISFSDSRAAVAQLLEALRYKPAGRGFDSRWCQ